VYDAREKKDLIWAIYNYFTWKKFERTVDGVVEAIYNLAVLAGILITPSRSSHLNLQCS